MRDPVPEDVIKQILPHLPVKSLLRFMSVRSSWQSFIKSPSFVSSHITRTNSRGGKDCQQPQLLLFGCWVDNDCQDSSKRQHSLLVDGREFKEYRKLENLPFQPSCKTVSGVVGSCNGLVCLKGKEDDSYHLWNPTVQKLFTVPKSNLIDKFRAFKDRNNDQYGSDIRFNLRTVEGLGFDSSSNDYKLLRIVHVFATDPNDDEIDWDGWFDIYSCNAGSWRGITPDGLHFSTIIIDDDFQSQVPFADGFLYCLGIDYQRFWRPMIWQFDVATEIFQEIRLPDELAEFNVLKSLTAYGDSSIALFEYPFSDDETITRLHPWLMQENDGAESWSWTKVPVIEEDEGFNLNVVPLLVRKNGEPVMEKTSRGIVSYDPHRKQCHYLCQEGYNASVHYYVESLALLNVENEATESKFESAFVDLETEPKNAAKDGDSASDADAVKSGAETVPDILQAMERPNKKGRLDMFQ